MLFRYKGEPEWLGHRGTNVWIEPGDTIDFDDGEIQKMELSTPHEWEVAKPLDVPPERRPTMKVASDTILTGAHDGFRLRCTHQQPITVTLPIAPRFGFAVDVQFGDSSGDSVTIDPGAAALNGETGPLVLTAAMDSIGLCFAPAVGWRTR